MTKDQIIALAREAGIDAFGSLDERLIFFAALVAAAEREVCCRIVTGLCISDNNAHEINKAIRARHDQRTTN